MGRRAGRAAGRRGGRRAARRTTRRVVRRRRRRRVMVGGMVLLAVGGTAAAIKMSKQDADRVEQHTGASVEELTDEELTTAMSELGIQSAELTPEEKAAFQADSAADAATAGAAVNSSAGEPDYLAELEKLAALRDQGIITAEDFEAKKKQLLGL